MMPSFYLKNIQALQWLAVLLVFTTHTTPNALAAERIMRLCITGIISAVVVEFSGLTMLSSAIASMPITPIGLALVAAVLIGISEHRTISAAEKICTRQNPYHKNQPVEQL